MSEGWVFEAMDVTGDYSMGEVAPYGAGGLAGAAQGLAGAKEGMSNVLSSAKVLGADSASLIGPLTDLAAALQITAGAFQLYKGVAATVAMARTAHQAAAAVEGAAAVANPFMWPNLAIAGAAMATVYATFQFASGEWQLPQVDISSISQRDQAAKRLTEVQ
jgi:hypothetical protein